MNRRIIVRRLAEIDVEGAVDWYDGQRPGLGAQFITQFNLGAATLAEVPDRWPAYRHQIRRYGMDRFPSSIFYEFDDSTVRILAVIHGARNPSFIVGRLET